MLRLCFISLGKLTEIVNISPHVDPYFFRYKPFQSINRAGLQSESSLGFISDVAFQRVSFMYL